MNFRTGRVPLAAPDDRVRTLGSRSSTALQSWARRHAALGVACALLRRLACKNWLLWGYLPSPCSPSGRCLAEACSPPRAGILYGRAIFPSDSATGPWEVDHAAILVFGRRARPVPHAVPVRRPRAGPDRTGVSI